MTKDISTGTIEKTSLEGEEGILFTIDADLILKNAKTIQDDLLSILPHYDKVSVATRTNCNIDLAGLQILLGLQKFAGSNGKIVNINLSLSPEAMLTVSHVGFAEFFNDLKNN